MTNYTQADLKKLWGLAGGLCSICRRNLIHEDYNMGEMAHVIAKKSGGARYRPLNRYSVNSYDNLILLCPNHHTIVDQDPKTYTIQELKRIKSDHEIYVANALDVTNPGRVQDILALRAFSFNTRLKLMNQWLTDLPIKVSTEILDFKDATASFRISYHESLPFRDQNLDANFDRFINDFNRLYGFVRNKEVNGVKLYDTVGDSMAYLYMQTRLPYEIKMSLKKEIRQHTDKLLDSYYKLIKYIKQFFPEVNLADYYIY